VTAREAVPDLGAGIDEGVAANDRIRPDPAGRGLVALGIGVVVGSRLAENRMGADEGPVADDDVLVDDAEGADRDVASDLRAGAYDARGMDVRDRTIISPAE
jgi:hypothetical protein